MQEEKSPEVKRVEVRCRTGCACLRHIGNKAPNGCLHDESGSAGNEAISERRNRRLDSSSTGNMHVGRQSPEDVIAKIHLSPVFHVAADVVVESQHNPWLGMPISRSRKPF